MNKKGVTILEILISVSLISIVILLLLKVMLSLDNINNDKTYASSDEIRRTTIIKNIESDLIDLNLKGVEIKKENDKVKINLQFKDEVRVIEVFNKKLTYQNETYELESSNASYDLCPTFKYIEIDEDFYLVSITIPVLINGKNTTINDDIVLTYMGEKQEDNNYNVNNVC